MNILIMTGLAALSCLLWFWQRADRRGGVAVRIDWRGLLARLPLPMLALAASWGVYAFARLYVPWPIAIIQAAAFELTYIGLAVTRGLDAAQRRRATLISVGAVVVSVTYNSIDGLFARNPSWLAALPPSAEIAGALLHGAPLAIVAYLVADLLLHSQQDQRRPAHRARLARLLWRLRGEARQLRGAHADLAQVRAMLDTTREDRLAQARELETARAEIAPLRERLAQIEPAAANLGRRVEEPGDQLRIAREEARRHAHEAAGLRERPAQMPPSRQQAIAYVRDALATGRSLLSVAEELDYNESTLRGWLKAATNGHALESATD